jgi:hypothetical protein
MKEQVFKDFCLQTLATELTEEIEALAVGHYVWGLYFRNNSITEATEPAF